MLLYYSRCAGHDFDYATLDQMLVYDYTVAAAAVAARASFMHHAELPQLVRSTRRVGLLRPPKGLAVGLRNAKAQAGPSAVAAGSDLQFREPLNAKKKLHTAKTVREQQNHL